MSRKTAKADLTPVRQRTQYTCMSTSMMMCLRALGHDCNEDEVNKVMGARPMKGAAWEQALACAQHYGVRATLTTPSTVRQLKQWTDSGKPVMIAWNPEGREWSHASVVFDVDDDLNVYVADPNIPDPDETVRVVSKGDFYKKWYEKWPNYLVRRPALMLDREITADGRQVMASRQKTAGVVSNIMDMESYKVDGTGRKGLTLTPITFSFDAWEYIGEDGGVEVSWGGHEALMDRREFASFAADMRKALDWASQYKYRKASMKKSTTTSATRVASAFARKAAEARIDNSLKRKINARMRRLGLDGNGRFRKPDRGFAAAVDAMQEHGVTLDGVVSAFGFSARPSGTVRTDIAFIDESQPFAPGITISNSILYLQYTEVSDDRFEVVAYLS